MVSTHKKYSILLHIHLLEKVSHNSPLIKVTENLRLIVVKTASGDLYLSNCRHKYVDFKIE